MRCVWHQRLSERKENSRRRHSSKDMSGSISLIITLSLALFITVRWEFVVLSTSYAYIDLCVGIRLLFFLFVHEIVHAGIHMSRYRNAYVRYYVTWSTHLHLMQSPCGDAENSVLCVRGAPAR